MPYHFTAQRYASAVYAMAPCLSVCVCVCVCVSVTSQCSSETAKHVKRTIPQIETLFLLMPKNLAKFQWGHPNGSDKYASGGKNFRLSTSSSQYLEKGIPQAQSSSAIAKRPRDARFTSIRKIAKWNFWATVLGLRGNVDASCIRRWKKRCRLPIGDNWTF